MKESNEERRSTSLKIKPSTWEDAKIQSIKHKKQLSVLVEEAIDEWIKNHKK